MNRPLVTWVFLAGLLACTTPRETPPLPGAPAADAGTVPKLVPPAPSALNPPANGSAAPPTSTPPNSPGRVREPGCVHDSDCPAGKVCDGCGNLPRTCITGCHDDSGCPPSQVCRKVQCIRCPCPGQCEAPH